VDEGVGHIATPCAGGTCSYAAPNAKSEAGDSGSLTLDLCYAQYAAVAQPLKLRLGWAASLLATTFGVSPSPTCLSAVWGRNRALCVNVLIHSHLCVSCFGRCRRDAHRYTFICQESVRNSGCGSPKIPGLDASAFRPVHRTSGRDGPEQRGGISLMSIHRSHICHIGGSDQGHFFHPPRKSGTTGSLRAT
jgi:hypothetical protein